MNVPVTIILRPDTCVNLHFPARTDTISEQDMKGYSQKERTDSVSQLQIFIDVPGIPCHYGLPSLSAVGFITSWCLHNTRILPSGIMFETRRITLHYLFPFSKYPHCWCCHTQERRIVLCREIIKEIVDRQQLMPVSVWMPLLIEALAFNFDVAYKTAARQSHEIILDCQ